MIDLGEARYELVRRMYDDLVEMRREQASIDISLSLLEQYGSNMAAELGRIRADVAAINNDLASMKLSWDVDQP
jgi:hypothetical protein